MLSDAILEFLERRPGQAFTARELWEHLRPRGRVLPCHIQQALERRLFPQGEVVADRVYLGEINDLVRAHPDTRWCAREGAPPGFLIYDPDEGIREYEEYEPEERGKSDVRAGY